MFRRESPDCCYKHRAPLWFITLLPKSKNVADKRQDIMAFAATWMDLQIVILSEVGQKEKDKYHRMSLLSSVQLLSRVRVFATPWMAAHQVSLSITNSWSSSNSCPSSRWNASMWNLNYDTDELIYETETDSQAYSTNLRSPRVREVGGGKYWEFGISSCELLYK